MLPSEFELLLNREGIKKKGLESSLYIQGVWHLLDEQNRGQEVDVYN